MVAIPEDLFYLNSFISLTAMIKKTAHWIQFPDIFFYFGDIRCTDSIQHRFDIKVKQMSASSKDHRIYKINFKGVNIILKTNLDNTFIREWQVLLFLDQERKKKLLDTLYSHNSSWNYRQTSKYLLATVNKFDILHDTA